jgi:hypothetical protein
MKKVFAVLLSSILWFVIGVLCSVVARAADTVTIQGSMKTHKIVIEPAKSACEKATSAPSIAGETPQA